jgi:Domain of unknown function (DUF4062)
MIPKKKLQVFVFSTYSDLKEERQAAVEAILSACHIPAGMELFAAGDESQMEVIRRWIDESDVFLLILGGRYGSVEPTSNKSYIELEYEYAQERGKPFFAVVIKNDYLKEKVKVYGADIIETDNAKELKAFRTRVLTKLVRFFSDPRDIKLAIHETLSDFSRRDELVGWIPGDQSVNSGAVAEEIARLGKENAMLRDRLSGMADTSPTFCGLTFENMCQMLSDEEINFNDLHPQALSAINDSSLFNNSKPSLPHFLWVFRDDLVGSGIAKSVGDQKWKDLDKLQGFGLVEFAFRTLGANHPAIVMYGLTDEGKRFLLRLRAKIKAEDRLSLSNPANGIA